MASKFRKSNTNIEVNLSYVIVMRPKLSWSANGARVQLQQFLCPTGNSMRYLEKWRQFFAISLVKCWCVFDIGQLGICMFCRWRLSFGYDTTVSLGFFCSVPLSLTNESRFVCNHILCMCSVKSMFVDITLLVD